MKILIAEIIVHTGAPAAVIDQPIVLDKKPDILGEDFRHLDLCSGYVHRFELELVRVGCRKVHPLGKPSDFRGDVVQRKPGGIITDQLGTEHRRKSSGNRDGILPAWHKIALHDQVLSLGTHLIIECRCDGHITRYVCVLLDRIVKPEAVGRLIRLGIGHIHVGQDTEHTHGRQKKCLLPFIPLGRVPSGEHHRKILTLLGSDDGGRRYLNLGGFGPLSQRKIDPPPGTPHGNIPF